MKVASRLDALREAHPGSAAVAFADLSARLVLCSSAQDRTPRERLDALLCRASEMLDGSGSAWLAGALDDAGTAPQEAIVAGPDGIELYIRTPARPDEALLCVCDAEADLAALGRAARAGLDEIAGVGQEAGA